MEEMKARHATEINTNLVEIGRLEEELSTANDDKIDFEKKFIELLKQVMDKDRQIAELQSAVEEFRSQNMQQENTAAEERSEDEMYN